MIYLNDSDWKCNSSRCFVGVNDSSPFLVEVVEVVEVVAVIYYLALLNIVISADTAPALFKYLRCARLSARRKYV